MSLDELEVEPPPPQNLSDVPTGRDSRVRYQVLAGACSLALVAYLHRVGFATAAPELKGPTGLTDDDVAYMMTAFMLAYGVVEIPFGILSDKFGARHVLAVIVLAWSVLTGATAFALLLPPGTVWPVAYLLLLRLAFGLFQGGMFPAISRIMADWMPVNERGLAQGCLWTSTRMGGVLAPLVVIKLFNVVGVGEVAFWGLASVGLIWCVWFWPWFRNVPEEKAGVNDVELRRIAVGRRPAAGHDFKSVPWGRMLRSRSVWCLCFTYGAIGLTGNFFLTMLTTYLRSHRHFSMETAGRISAVPFACGLVGCLAGGYLSDVIIRRTGSRRWGRRVVGSFGLSLGAVAMASTLLVEDPVWLAVLFGVAFLGNDLAMAPAWAACADIGEHHAGTLGGAMNMLGSFGGAFGAMTVKTLLSHGQAVPLFLFFAAVYVTGAILWMGVDTRQTLAVEPTPGESHG